MHGVRIIVIAALALAACDAAGVQPPAIEQVLPDHGPLVGGTRIVIHGSGFLANDAGPTRVIVGGREAPLAGAIGDAMLEVVIPHGDAAGDVELVVFNRNGNAIAPGRFRYSTPPTITSITPADVVFDASATTMTLTGSGFIDDGAGEVSVLVDGVPAADVVVTDDATLTFTAPGGQALSRPEVQVIDARGIAIKPRGFRYTPSARPGLLLFPASSATFVIFYDPIAGSSVTIPRVGPFSGFTAVAVDDRGDYWGIDRFARFGFLDLASQTLQGMVQLPFRVPSVTWVATELYGIDRSSLRFGTLDPGTGVFTHIGTGTVPCCGSFGLAFDGTTLYLAARSNGTPSLYTIDRTTGQLGAPVTLTGVPSLHIEEMRFFGGKLYAASRDSILYVIDPATGATTARAALGRFKAMEVFE